MKNYAGIETRFFALVIDGLLCLIPGILLGKVFPLIGGALVWFFYAPLLECSALEGTIGKYWMELRVTDLEGNRLSFQAALLRNLVKLFSSAILCLGYLMAFMNPKKQTLHDFAANSIILKGRTEQSIQTAWLDSIHTHLLSRFEGAGGRASGDTISKLERLQKLHEKGALSDEEFEKAKKDILGS